MAAGHPGRAGQVVKDGHGVSLDSDTRRMAKKADLDKPISPMRPATAKAVQQILDRANKAAAAKSRAALPGAGRISTGAGRSRKPTTRTLGLALASHGSATKGVASMKQKAIESEGGPSTSLIRRTPDQ